MVYLGKDRVNLNPNFAAALSNNANNGSSDYIYNDTNIYLGRMIANESHTIDDNSISVSEVHNCLKSGGRFILRYTTENQYEKTANTDDYNLLNEPAIVYQYSAYGYQFTQDNNSANSDGYIPLYLKLYFHVPATSSSFIDCTLVLHNTTYYKKNNQ